MKKEELAASLNRENRRLVRTSAPPAPPEVGEQHSVGSSSVRKVRSTFDLVAQEFRDFRTWRDEQADKQNWARLTVQDTLRVLVRQLLTDEQLQEKVIDQLKREAR
jgi:hypothetical protein